MKIYESHELSNTEYHSDRTSVSSSTIKAAFKGKESFEEYLNTPNNPSEAMLLGTYVHALVLEPKTVASDFATYEGARRAGKVWDEFKTLHEGKDILLSSQRDLGNLLAAEFANTPEARELISDGRPEVSFFTELEGVNVKVRTDWLRNDGAIVDLKTTGGSLVDYEISHTIAQWKYELSAALYCDVLEQWDGKKHDFYFVFLSKKDGRCRCFKASESLLAAGREKYKLGLQLIKSYYEIQTEEPKIKEISLPNHY